MLFLHCLSIVILYFQIFQIDINTFHIYFHSHSIIVKSHGDVFQFFQPGYVGFYQCDLLSSGLSQIIYLTYFQNKIFSRFFIRKTVHLIHYFGNGYGGIKRLVVKRHLKLKTCVGVVLQGISYVIRISIGRTVGDRYGWIYIVIIVGKPIDLR